MAFDYNPDDKVDSGGSAEAGVYDFVVDVITETTFRSGNDGWKVELLVAAFPDRDIRVYDNMVNVPNALWKFEQFCQAFGLDFGNPPRGGYQPRDFEGKRGRAVFEKGDRGYLQVEMYSAAPANNGPDTRRAQPEHIQQAADADTPF